MPFSIYTDKSIQRKNRFAGFLLLLLICGMLSAGGCTTAPDVPSPDPSAALKEDDVVSRWGIRPVSIRLTGADHFIDFRYRVISSDKAAQIMTRNTKPYLIHEPSSTVMPVPVTKLGPLRGTSVKPKENKQYVVLFNNINKAARTGDKVTIVLGDLRMENLTVGQTIQTNVE